MRTPSIDVSIFKERRERLGQKIRGSALLLASNPHVIRNNDVHYAYRQDSNMFYMTGFEETDAVFLFRPGRKPETVMFVLPKDPLRETWDGFLYGPEATKNLFGIDVVYTVDKIDAELATLLKDVDKVYYQLYLNPKFDQVVNKTIESVAVARSRTNKGNLTIEDTRALLGEMRIRKSPEEIEWQRKACRISSEAHIDVMKACKPGVNERGLHGEFLRAMMIRGAAREGYGAIVATGGNGTTLHYVFNDAQTKDGDMLLIDAGAEYNYFSGDITRTYPVNGKFSSAQKRVYGKVLAIQKGLIEMVKPGVTRDEIQKRTIDQLTTVMIEEGLLKGNKADLIEKKAYLKYYMHGVGHWLGMDVHDAGVTEINGEPRPLEEGFVLTIEPGLYVPSNDEEAPSELRGMAIRIEDNILVTKDGHENMTIMCPKEIDELEAIIGK